MKRLAFAAAAVIGSVVSAGAQITSNEAERLTSAAQVVQEIRGSIPQEYLDRAHCVAVIPNLKKAAFIFGGEYGKGLMSCRAGDQWSAPLFMQLAKGSWGFQAGAEEVDVVLLVMNESGVQKLLKNKVTLGADASIAAGPLGRQGHIGTDAQMTAEILSYSRARGLFAGINLSGGVLRPDEDANRNAYGENATARTILASREISAPTQATPFVRALTSVSQAEVATRESSSAAPRSTTSPAPSASASASDADLRARVADMQRTLDRLLSDAGQSPVGTTGAEAAASTTVGVDRAALARLRQQLDAIIAAIERR